MTGKITAALGSALSLAPSAVHGCDVRDIGADGFTFTLTHGNTLPYPDHHFDLITSLMVFHHVRVTIYFLQHRGAKNHVFVFIFVLLVVVLRPQNHFCRFQSFFEK